MMVNSLCIIVIGVHRSGTSAVAGVMYKLGVFMGNQLQPKDSSNPRGHFEDREFQALNKQAIGGVLAWKHPCVDFAPVKQQYSKLIAQREKMHKVWGFKDPRTCFTLPYILPLFRGRVKIINVRRGLAASAASMVRRGKQKGVSKKVVVNNKQALRIARAYNGARNLALKLCSLPVLHVDFDELINSPTRITHEIAHFCEVPFKANAARHIDPKLRHHRS